MTPDPFIIETAQRERREARHHLDHLVAEARRDLGLPSRFAEDLDLIGQRVTKIGEAFTVGLASAAAHFTEAFESFADDLRNVEPTPIFDAVRHLTAAR